MVNTCDLFTGQNGWSQRCQLHSRQQRNYNDVVSGSKHAIQSVVFIIKCIRVLLWSDVYESCYGQTYTSLVMVRRIRVLLWSDVYESCYGQTYTSLVMVRRIRVLLWSDVYESCYGQTYTSLVMVRRI